MRRHRPVPFVCDLGGNFTAQQHHHPLRCEPHFGFRLYCHSVEPGSEWSDNHVSENRAVTLLTTRPLTPRRQRLDMLTRDIF
jgi:hypothetical protein